MWIHLKKNKKQKKQKPRGSQEHKLGLVKLCILCIEGNLRRNLLIFILYFNCFSDQKFFYYLPPCPSLPGHSDPTHPHPLFQVSLWSSTAVRPSVTSPWSFLFSPARPHPPSSIFGSPPWRAPLLPDPENLGHKYCIIHTFKLCIFLQ